MSATGLNHVSIGAYDLGESTRFYEDVLAMVQVPSFRFAQPVVWLRLGSVQLHLFQRSDGAPQRQHVGLDVDDFEAVYAAVRAHGLLDDTLGHHCYELPDASVQAYFRDPGDNLIEIDWPHVGTLDRTVVNDIRSLDQDIPQEQQTHASLFLRR